MKNLINYIVLRELKNLNYLKIHIAIDNSKLINN